MVEKKTFKFRNISSTVFVLFGFLYCCRKEKTFFKNLKSSFAFDGVYIYDTEEYARIILGPVLH